MPNLRPYLHWLRLVSWDLLALYGAWAAALAFAFWVVIHAQP